MAFKEWSKRYKQLKEEPDSDFRASVGQVLTRARITTMEWEFLYSTLIALDPKEERASVTAINKSIELLGKAKLDSTHLNATIWGFAQKVLRGERLAST